MRVINGKRYTTKEDLQNRFYGEEQYKPGGKSANSLFFALSSGTTGKLPTMLLFGVTLNRIVVEHYNKIFSKGCLLINSANCARLRFVQVCLNHFPDSRGILALNKRDIDHPLISSAIADFKPKTIFSQVSLFNSFADKLSERKKLGAISTVKQLHVTGEALSEAMSGKFKKILPKKEIKLNYGASGISVIGVHCKYAEQKHRHEKFSVFHLTKPNLTEIVEQDKSGVGEIAVFTPELSYYLTGDSGRIIEEKCPCGASKTLILCGRKDYDVINCVGAVFLSSDVEKVFYPLGKYIEDYFLEIKEVFEKNKTLGSVTIKVVPKKELLSMKDGGNFIREYVKKHLQLTKTRHLGDLVRDKLFIEPKVVFVSSFPVSNKKIRMKKVN